jgi:ATP-dependent Lon protease
MILFLYMTKNTGDSPKKTNKSEKQPSDDDSSSDYDPQKDEIEDMDTLEMQKFMQKIFPSKSGKERVKQLEKIDKLMDKSKKSSIKKSDSKKSVNKKSDSKKSVNKKTVNKKIKQISREEESEDMSEDMSEEDMSEDDMSEGELEEFMKKNMKFNIIFSVPQGRSAGYDDEWEDENFEEEEYEDDDSKRDSEDDDSKRDSEDEESDDETSNMKKSPKSKNKSKNKSKIYDKPIEGVTEEEWDEMLHTQEKDMKKDGTYYNTKYEINQKVLIKMKGWDDFKNGKIHKVHKNSKRTRVKYDILLDKKYKGKKLYKTILSRNIKSNEKDYAKKENEEDELMNELKQLIDAKKNGDDGLIKKFEELSKAKVKKDEKKNKKKEEKIKEKNFFHLRKLLREKNVMNDFKYFKKLDLDVQTKILTKLKDVNSYSNVEKPYRISLIESDIPIEFKAYAMKKINTLEYMDPSSGEYYKNKQWVDTFMRIPFNKHENLPISMADGPEKCQEFIENAKNILDKAVYGLKDAKLQILQMIGQWISNPNAIGTAIAIKGPPGTGKTSLIKEGVSKILNRPFAFLALGGATDSSFLEGHSYTYEGSHWGKIVDILIKCKCMNPVFYFDELDKISQTPKGDEIVGILTHLTDTSQNDKFHDKYFANIDFDLRKSMFIFSYNDESKINPILKDRMYSIQTDGYKTDDKYIIARDYLIPKIEENVNFEKDQIIFPEETINHISNSLTDNEKGVRNLKRCLEIIYTKLNLYRLMKKGSILFDEKEIITVEFPFTVTIEIIGKLIKKTKEEGGEAPVGMYI